jgi:CubicO group peptidase (beta-lactamase class C family)
MTRNTALLATIMTAVLVIGVGARTGRTGNVPSTAEKNRADDASPVVDGALGQRLDQYMESLEKTGFSGGLVVVDRGRVILSKGYGLADRGHSVPFSTNTIISMGSITKMFTAAGILKLQMQGKLRVQDPLQKFFGTVPADKAKITVAQLLTHTAGFKMEVGRDFEPLERDAFLNKAFASPLNFRPGTRADYSNVGFSVAAAVIEIASGQNYEQYLRDQLFVPAGMTETGYHIANWTNGIFAHGYEKGTDWGTIPGHWGASGPYWNLLGNGGIHTTVGDMYRWYQALNRNEVLSAAAKQQFFTAYTTEAGDQPPYGYGCSVRTTPVGKLIFKNGGDGIFYAEFRDYVDHDLMYFIASNNAEMPGMRASEGILRMVQESRMSSKAK